MSDAILLSEMVGGGEWREHHKAPGYYFSSEGFAARVTARRGQRRICLLKGCSSGFGYRAISYPIGGGNYGRLYIHRAVCELFNGAQPEGATCVRHLDCDMTNNRASNLAWGTHADNMEDAKRNGKVARGERNGMAKLTVEQVMELRRMRSDMRATYKQLASMFGVSTMTAFRAAKGQAWN